MIVRDGICYPDSFAPVLSVTGCSVLDSTHLRVRFNTDAVRIVDISPLFDFAALAPLKDPEVLRAFSIDHGILNWLDGEIDIAPEWLLDHGIPSDGAVSIQSAPCVAEAPAEYDAGAQPDESPSSDPLATP